MKNIYLDIDGVLIPYKSQEQVSGVLEFLKYITENFEVFWLTTHCKSERDLMHVRSYVSRWVPGSEKYIEKIRPTYWYMNKTEGIDFTKDFLCLMTSQDNLNLMN